MDNYDKKREKALSGLRELQEDGTLDGLVSSSKKENLLVENANLEQIADDPAHFSQTEVGYEDLSMNEILISQSNPIQYKKLKSGIIVAAMTQQSIGATAYNLIEDARKNISHLLLDVTRNSCSNDLYTMVIAGDPSLSFNARELLHEYGINYIDTFDDCWSLKDDKHPFIDEKDVIISLDEQYIRLLTSNKDFKYSNPN